MQASLFPGPGKWRAEGSTGERSEGTVDFEVDGFDFPVGQSTILLAGPKSNSSGVVISRLKNDGSVDATFGTAGRLTVGSSAWSRYVTNLISQSDGKFLVVDGNGLSRYLADGGIDASFHSIPLPQSHLDGLQSGSNGFQSLREHGGQPYFYDYDSGRVISFLADGSRQDKQFIFSESSLSSASLLVTASGKVVLGGSCNDPEDGWGAETDLCVFRANVDGSIDTDFGKGGGLYIAASETGTDSLIALSEQSDGKILAFRVSQNRSVSHDGHDDWNFVLTRIK